MTEEHQAELNRLYEKKQLMLNLFGGTGTGLDEAIKELEDRINKKYENK